MRKQLFIYLCILAIIFSSCKKDEGLDITPKPAYENLPLSQAYSSRLDVVLDSVCSAMQIKGASVAVYVPNKGLWQGAYGFSHSNFKINSGMALTIGSNTKTYIAALMLKLQEEGVLNINNKVSQYLPSAPYMNNTITIKQLLNHTTGFGDFSFNPAFIQAIQNDFERVWQPIEMYPFFEAPIGAIGTYSYSDQNYLLAGLVIEKATGKPLKTSMRNLILNPANLIKTVYYPFEQTDLPIPHSWSADFGTGSLDDLDEVAGYSRIAFCSADNAAGGMMSTAKENAIFWNRLMNGKIINQTSLNLILDCIPAPTNNGQYGLGIQKTLNSLNGRTYFSHNGYVPGSVNDNAYDPVSGVVITVLTNQDQNRDLGRIINSLHKVTLQN
jgi:D-alanyl-D-alanine carboxypeptidase